MKDLTDFSTSTSNDVYSSMSTAASQIRSILEGATKKFTPGLIAALGIDDFTGINEQGLTELQGAIKKYCEAVQAKVNEFNENATIENAFKGEVADAISTFVKETKKLINAFVSNVMQESVEAGEIFKAYRTGASDIQKNVSTGVDELRRNAQAVQFDNPGTTTGTPAGSPTNGNGTTNNTLR